MLDNLTRVASMIARNPVEPADLLRSGCLEEPIIAQRSTTAKLRLDFAERETAVDGGIVRCDEVE